MAMPSARKEAGGGGTEYFAQSPQSIEKFCITSMSLLSYSTRSTPAFYTGIICSGCSVERAVDPSIEGDGCPPSPLPSKNVY